MQKKDVTQLKTWFQSQSRDLPWRENPSPYSVWISEVMLQQTQAAVVVPYFERWMKRFPTIQTLAQASIEEVLKEWEGLGYYSRARYLHEGARYVLQNFDGILPSTADALNQIKGLGSYTIGAILSFAFHQRQAAVDGNVMRVLTRYYGLPDDISKGKTLRKIQQLAADLLPEQEPWIISEALIELGATVCMRKPKCLECPLQNKCTAYSQDMTSQIPFKSTKTTITPLYRAVAVIIHNNHLLISRGTKGKIMADLCEFPYIELETPSIDQETIQNHMLKQFQLKLEWKKGLKEVKHSFTRYQALLIPISFLPNIKYKQKSMPGYQSKT